MSSCATRTAQNSDLVRPIQEVRKQVEFFRRRTNGWCGFLKVQTRAICDGMLKRDIAGNGNDSNTTFGDGSLHGNLEHARHLLRLRYQLAVMAALREEMFGISLLKISTANFLARNLGGDGEDGNAAALTIVEAVNQMHVAGATTSGTYCQLASEMGLGADGERRCLLVSYTNPANVLSNANRIGNSVERVAGDSIDPLDTGFSQNVNQQLGHCFSRHIHPSRTILPTVLMQSPCHAVRGCKLRFIYTGPGFVPAIA